MKRFNLVYKTVNMTNNKFYIGKHSTDDLDDGYLGSGLLLKAAIEMYGKENFKREILHCFSSDDDAVAMEKKLVNEELLSNPYCYNIALGGCGGNLGPEVNKKIGIKMSEILSGIPKTSAHKNALRKVWIEKNHTLTPELKSRIGNSVSKTWKSMSVEERQMKCGHPKESNGFFGKKHSEASLTQMKAKLPDRSGSNNPRAKKVTINNVTYNTQKECMEALKISKRKLYTLLGESQ